jgi:curved DNA-binding protein CbpA
VKPLAQQTFYELLEIPPDAPVADIDAAYARARALYGPDSIATYTLLAPEEAELLRARLDEARATLMDPEARARYDERLAALAAALPAPSTAWAPPRHAPPAPIQLLSRAPEDAEEDEREQAPLAPVTAAAPAEPPAQPASTPLPRSTPIRLDREVSRPAMTPPPVPVAPPAPASPGVAYAAEATSWTGEVLRNVREARGISIQQISERTKVARHHIESIEADRFAVLPAPVYLRGILMGLARELRLDGQKVARSYLGRMAAAASAGAPASAPRR